MAVHEFANLAVELERLGQEAGSIAQAVRREGMVRELKPDGSIVTSADRDVETFLRSSLPKLIEGVSIWGEEFGFEPEGPNGVWAVDPIDGTSNFAFRSPLWGVSIAWIVNSRIRLGCVVLPDLDEIYMAIEGGGATMNNVKMSDIPSGGVRPEELISFNETVAKAMANGPRVPGKRRDLGAFVVSGAFVANQRCRGLVAMNEKLYDCAASILLCQELGAEIRYVDGRPLEIGPLVADVKIRSPWVIFPQNSRFGLENP